VPSTEDITELVRGLGIRLNQVMTTRASHLRGRLDALASRPAFSRPTEGIRLRERRADELSLRLHAAVKRLVRDRQASMETLAGKLETLSPLGVLGRGYSLTYTQDGKKLVTAAATLKPGQRIVTQFQHGTAVSVIESVEELREK
jgi:exodeoxyribonuclease VII large subunit